MPQSACSPPSPKRSENGPSPKGIDPEEDPKPGRTSGIFTAAPAPAPRPPSEQALEEKSPQKDLFRKKAQRATDPFPEGLFRMPVPDRLFSEMKTMSDSGLRALLGLIRLSFRFDPKTGEWVRPSRSFRRSDVEEECGLSSQGTRDGLEELAEAGWVSVDRTGRSHEYELVISVPEDRYTYLPTRFLEEAGALTGTELRLVLTVLRGTWGWTCPSGELNQVESSPQHRRWARLPVGTLSKLTGRSETAVKKAARSLSGRYLRRRRPTGGAYYYRFLPGGLTETEGSEEPARNGSSEHSGRKAIEVKKRARCARSLRPAQRDTSPERSASALSRGIANNLAPHRQQSDPPQPSIESFSKREAQHRAREAGSSAEPNSSGEQPETSPASAVLEDPTSSPPVKTNAPIQKQSGRSSSRRGQADGSTSNGEITLDRFSDRLQKLGRALMNIGVRPRATAQLLSRHSAERIRANLELYRQRASGVKRPGAWVFVAIRDGYALPRPETGDWGEKLGPEGDSSGSPGKKGRPGSPSPLPEPGTKVSETRKRGLIARGLATDADFKKFADYDGKPDRKQHFFQLEKR